MKKIVFILTGGQIRDLTFLQSKVAELNPIEIICADSGADHAYAIGIVPQVIIGDMDSLRPAILEYCKEQGSRIIRYPEAKEETDTQLALEYAINLAPDEVYVFGAFGSRIDHVLGNMSLMIFGAKKGMQVKLVDEWCEAFVITDGCVIDGEIGQTVSLLPFSDVVTGITLDGFEYPLHNGMMEMGQPYGISNRLAAARAVISIHSGFLLVVRYFDARNLP
ncbi:MAG: thiamine diphosphokinase [Syntrophaceae bacterium]